MKPWVAKQGIDSWLGASARVATPVTETVVRAFHRVGLDVSRYPPIPAHSRWRQRVLSDAAVTVVLDVGANTGQYATAIRRYGYSGRIISFEPLHDAFAELERNAALDPQWECYRLAIGSQDGTTDIHVAANSYSSSILPMLDTHTRAAPESTYVGSQIVTMARLDTIRRGLLNEADRVFLKLDVQGYELEVLRGAEELLEQVQGLETELSLVPLYAGQPVYHEVIDYLLERGLVLVSLADAFRDPHTGQLLQIDGLFTRR